MSIQLISMVAVRQGRVHAGLDSQKTGAPPGDATGRFVPMPHPVCPPNRVRPPPGSPVGSLARPAFLPAGRCLHVEPDTGAARPESHPGYEHGFSPPALRCPFPLGAGRGKAVGKGVALPLPGALPRFFTSGALRTKMRALGPGLQSRAAPWRTAGPPAAPEPQQGPRLPPVPAHGRPDGIRRGPAGHPRGPGVRRPGHGWRVRAAAGPSSEQAPLPRREPAVPEPGLMSSACPRAAMRCHSRRAGPCTAGEQPARGGTRARVNSGKTPGHPPCLGPRLSE